MLTNLVRASFARLTARNYAPWPTAYDGLFPNGTWLTAPGRRASLDDRSEPPAPERAGGSVPNYEAANMEISQQQLTAPDPNTPAGREAIAATLVTAWRERTYIEAPSRRSADFSQANALAIAERVRDLRIADGAQPIGYKVGFTNAAVREQFDAAGPLAATVYAQTLSLAPRIDARHLLGPRIEPEVVVGLGQDGEPAWAALGFEIVQSHVPDWKFGYVDAIADFGLHAALIVGERRPVGAGGTEMFTTMTVRLLCNGEVVEHGAASNVEGGALGSLRWLRDDLRRVGRELLPGEIVSTGSMTRVPAIAAGERWTIESTGNELPALSIDVG